MSLICVFLFFNLLSGLDAASFSSGSRSILRAVSIGDSHHNDYAIDVNATNFDSVLSDTPARFAVVEFFANWCPACRNYKPHYEKVARLFNGPEAVHPGIVLMTRVDCALKINSKLCEKFSITHYPMLFWAVPTKFVMGSWDPKQEKSEIRVVDDGRTAERLLNWINKQIGSSYALDDEKFENEHLPSNVSNSEQISQAIYDIEEATATAFDIIVENKMVTPRTRASLIRFFQLLVAHHPSRRCRKGAAEVLVDVDDICTSKSCLSDKVEAHTVKTKGLGNFQICGKEVPRGYWMFCRGSKNDTRGFSCGLWILMHSLSVRVEDEESQFAFTATCEFINNYFVCQECRQHFYDMCSSVTTPFTKARDFVLWLWTAHNKVNQRLMKDEASLKTGDPKFPKTIWPPKQLCSSCYLSQNKNDDGSNQIKWDHDEVFKFLKNYYGQSLVSRVKDKDFVENDEAKKSLEDLLTPTNAVVVPVGAALAIALASCAFGALACYWRSHQKNRKYNRHPHYLKNI